MKKLLSLCSVLWVLFSPIIAQNTTNSPKKEAQEAQKTIQNTQSPKDSLSPNKLVEATQGQKIGQSELPMLPQIWFQRLWDSCTLVDYTFFTMPITISLDRQESIRGSLRHIGVGQVVRKTECKQFAKVFYQIKGQIVLEADMFFSDNGCSYAIYNVGGKPTFANPISTEGVQFLNQIIARQKGKK